MNSLYANIINETEKLFLKKKTVALGIIAALVPLAAALLIGFFQNRIGIMVVNGTDFPVFILGVFTSLIIPLLVAMTAADTFSGEIGDRTIKISLSKPVTRLKIYLSKLAAIGIYICVSLSAVFVISLVSGLFLKGGGFSIGLLAKEILAYAAAALPMLLLGIMAAALGMLFKSSSGALTASIFAFIGLKTVSVIFPGISRLLVTSFTNWHLLWLSGFAASGKILTVFMFMVGYSIIFLALGYYAFERKEF